MKTLVSHQLQVTIFSGLSLALIAQKSAIACRCDKLRALTAVGKRPFLRNFLPRLAKPRQNVFDIRPGIVLLVRVRIMKAALTKMQTTGRVNGHVSIWQRCPLSFGNADSEF